MPCYPSCITFTRRAVSLKFLHKFLQKWKLDDTNKINKTTHLAHRHSFNVFKCCFKYHSYCFNNFSVAGTATCST